MTTKLISTHLCCVYAFCMTDIQLVIFHDENFICEQPAGNSQLLFEPLVEFCEFHMSNKILPFAHKNSLLRIPFLKFKILKSELREESMMILKNYFSDRNPGRFFTQIFMPLCRSLPWNFWGCINRKIKWKEWKKKKYFDSLQLRLKMFEFENIKTEFQ